MPMKMARASEQDLEVAQQTASFIEFLQKEWVPEAMDSDDDVFDIEDPEQCQQVLRKLLEINDHGSIFRVTFGLLVLLDPANKLIDPDADTLELHPDVTRLQAENAALQQRLNVADELVDDLKKDKERLDALEANFWDVRHHSSALGDTGDYTSCVEIVGRWMDKPHERVIGENYDENLRAAIDQAMTADAYPPERPEYPELDAALSDEDWHMNPCKLGHRDVGACGGKAFCHTCDETITAATTQEAFAQWNATHPAATQ